LDGDLRGERKMSMNPVLFLQTEIVHLYMRKYKLSPRQFLELDKKYDILGFLEIGYEQFHLTGPQGVLEELENYIAEHTEKLPAEQRQRSPLRDCSTKL
jgi:hypothetical protein